MTAEQVRRLAEESVITDLMDRALAALARSRRTRRELEVRLRKREAPPPLITAALDRLEAAGILSDAAVASAEARARLRRGDAPALVSQRLRRKGIDPETLADALSDAIDEAAEEGTDEATACRVLAEKRVRTLQSLPKEVAERRLMGFLMRRGYGGALARRTAREVLHSGQ